MGYCTYYEGSIYDGVVNERDVAVAIGKLGYFDLSERDLAEVETIDDVISIDSMKWYDHIRDMEEVSRQFPDVTIMLHGEGEENGDMWNAYFKNGKHAIYRAEIIYPEFNPDDLR